MNSQREAELNPCPFCGSTRIGIVDGVMHEGWKFHKVFCKSCQMRTEPIPGIGRAIARWNTRQAATEQGVGEPVAEFGNGDWVVEVGGYGGKPTVFVRPSDPPGVPGELAPPTSEEDKHRLLDGEWFMTFPTEAQAFAVADALTGRKLRRLDGTRPDDAKPNGGGVPDEWVRAMQRVIDWFDACNDEGDLICPREEYARIKALLATQQPPTGRGVPDGLIEFAKRMLAASRDGCGVDGADIQDWALECGLIEPYFASEPCCSDCVCAEVANFPTECYRDSTLLATQQPLEG